MDAVDDVEQLREKTLALFRDSRVNGFRKGASMVIVNVLRSRFGEVPVDLVSEIENLEPIWLDALSKIVVDLESLDLTAALVRQIRSEP